MKRNRKTLVLIGLVALLLIPLHAQPLGAKESQDRKSGRWLKVRVYEGKSPTPTVLVNLPMSLVSAAMRVVVASGALHAAVDKAESEGHCCLRINDVDVQTLFQEIEKMEPGQIIEIQDKGDRVAIWIE